MKITGYGHEIEVNIEKITPEMAKELLENKEKNRQFHRVFINKYKQDLLSNSFKLNGQTLIINNQGQLIDGQHRLRAVIESGKPLIALVVRGIKTGMQDTIDMGRSRTLGDLFQMKGAANSHLLARTSKLLLAWNEKFEEIKTKKGFTQEVMNYPPHKVYEYYDQNRIEIDRATEEYRKNTPIITATKGWILAFCFSVFEKIDPDKCYIFMKSYVTGHIKSEWGDSMIKIREDFLQLKGNRQISIRESERISLLFGLWNVIYHKQDVKEISKDFNIPFELNK